jgi:hypothetical protein
MLKWLLIVVLLVGVGGVLGGLAELQFDAYSHQQDWYMESVMQQNAHRQATK